MRSRCGARKEDVLFTHSRAHLLSSLCGRRTPQPRPSWSSGVQGGNRDVTQELGVLGCGGRWGRGKEGMVREVIT